MRIFNIFATFGVLISAFCYVANGQVPPEIEKMDKAIAHDLNVLEHPNSPSFPRAFTDLRARFTGKSTLPPQARVMVFAPSLVCRFSRGHERELAPIISRYLTDPDDEVRREALISMSCMQPESHLPEPLLKHFLFDKSRSVRLTALDMIAEIPGSLPPLVPTLQKMVQSDPDSYVRQDALGKLAQATGPTPATISLLTNLMELDANEPIRRTALSLLIRISAKNPTAKAVVMHLIESPGGGVQEDLRYQALNECPNLYNHDTRFADVLIKIVHTGDPLSSNAASLLPAQEPLSIAQIDRLASYLKVSDSTLQVRTIRALRLNPSFSPPHSPTDVPNLLIPLRNPGADLNLSAPKPARTTPNWPATTILSPANSLPLASQKIFYAQFFHATVDDFGGITFPHSNSLTLTTDKTHDPFAPQQTVPIALRLLRDSAATARVAGAFALGSLPNASHDAVNALIGALDDRDASVRKAAAIALGTYGSLAQAAGSPLARIVTNDSDAPTRVAAVETLCSVGAPGEGPLSALVSALRNDQSASVRVAAVDTLHCLDPTGKTSLKPIMRATADQSPQVREVAYRALGAYGEDAAIVLPLLSHGLATIEGTRHTGPYTTSIENSIGEAMYNIALDARSRNDVTALAPLKVADSLLNQNSNLKREYSYAVQISIQYLDVLRRSTLEYLVMSFVSAHVWLLYLTAAVGFYLVLVMFWLLLLWRRPLWIQRADQRLDPIYEALPLKPWIIQIPLQYVLAISWVRHRDRVLDAWVEHYGDKYARAFRELQTIRDRIFYLPLPVQINRKMTSTLSGTVIAPLLAQEPTRIVIAGLGGVGKTTLACQIAKWALDSFAEADATRMLPVLIEQDCDGYADLDPSLQLSHVVRDKLINMISFTDTVGVPIGFVNRLLRRGRILVIADSLSELSSFTQSMIAPHRAHFAAQRLVITSRESSDSLASVTAVVEPCLLQKGTLALFLDGYLSEMTTTDYLGNKEFHAACEDLVQIVGDQEVTAFFAKLYADQLIDALTESRRSDVARNIPDLILSHLAETNRKVTEVDREDDANVIAAAKIMAWECVGQRLTPGSGSVESALVALEGNLRIGREGAIQIFRYCEKRLKLVHNTSTGSTSGRFPTRERYRFSLDPIAEYLAALYVLENCRDKPDEWRKWLQPAIGAGKESRIENFVVALQECCRIRGTIFGINKTTLDFLQTLSQRDPDFTSAVEDATVE